MGENDSTAFGAVELPRPRVVPSRDRRRHRPLTGTAGLLLFVCLFLPAVDGCSEPVVPLDLPAVWAPYLYGLVLSFAVLARSRRGVVGATYALRALTVLVILGGAGTTILAGLGGVFVMAYGVVVLQAIGWSAAASERRIAATAIVVGATSCVWFAMWTTTPSALLGVKLSLASSLALLVGALAWVAETRGSDRRTIPTAILRGSPARSDTLADR